MDLAFEYLEKVRCLYGGQLSVPGQAGNLHGDELHGCRAEGLYCRIQGCHPPGHKRPYGSSVRAACVCCHRSRPDGFPALQRGNLDQEVWPEAGSRCAGGGLWHREMAWTTGRRWVVCSFSMCIMRTALACFALSCLLCLLSPVRSRNSWGGNWGFDEYAFPWPKCLHRVLKVKDIIGGRVPPRGLLHLGPLGSTQAGCFFALCEMIVFFCSDSFAKLSVRWGMSLVPALLFALLITRVASRWQCVPSVVGEAWRVAIDRPACQAKKKFKSFVPAARTIWAASFVGKRRVKWGRWKRRRLRRRWTLLLREGGHGLMLPNVRRHAQREAQRRRRRRHKQMKQGRLFLDCRDPVGPPAHDE